MNEILTEKNYIVDHSEYIIFWMLWGFVLCAGFVISRLREQRRTYIKVHFPNNDSDGKTYLLHTGKYTLVEGDARHEAVMYWDNTSAWTNGPSIIMRKDEFEKSFVKVKPPKK